MNPIKIENLSKIQIGMLNEYVDLILNGYMVRFQSFTNSWWYVRMQHISNGRTLTLQWKPEIFEIKEGKRSLKAVGSLL